MSPNLHRYKFPLITGSLALFIAPLVAQTSSTHQMVWHWYAMSSRSETLQVRVVYNGKTVFRSSFPIDSVERAQIVPQKPQKVLKFSFKGDPKTFDSEFRVHPVQRIEGNIWEAGCDPKDILLGVSFVIPKQILLNTVHFALPRQSARSQLANGLFIETNPQHVESKSQ